MSLLVSLVEKVNPTLSPQHQTEIVQLYKPLQEVDSFESDWSPTRPVIRGQIFENRGYQRLDSGRYIPPNTNVGPFKIDVGSFSFPQFLVDYEPTGKVSPRGRTIRTNLFNSLAGWSWVSGRRPLAKGIQRHTKREGDVLISVDDGRNHYYTLSFSTGELDGLLYTKPSSGEPRNRPSVRGLLSLGPIVGTIRTRSSGKIHPVYETITVVSTNQDGLEPLRRLN